MGVTPNCFTKISPRSIVIQHIFKHFFSSWTVMFATFETSVFQHHYRLSSKQLHETKFDKCLLLAAGHKIEEMWAKIGSELIHE